MVGLHQLHDPPAATLLLITIQASKKKLVCCLWDRGQWMHSTGQETGKTVQICLKGPEGVTRKKRSQWRRQVADLNLENGHCQGKDRQCGLCQKDCADWTDSAVDQRCAVLC